MNIETARYDVRLLELQPIRNFYMPLFENGYQQFWGSKATVWLDELEGGFEWVIQEAIQEILGCRVENHHTYDFGKCMYQTFPNLLNDIRPYIEVTRFQEYGNKIRHAKVMVLGNLLILAILLK